MPTPTLGLTKAVPSDGIPYWLDSRYFPMLGVRIFGKPSLPLAEHFEKWLNEMADFAASRGEKVIIVNDFSNWSVPAPDVRKAMAHHANTMNSNPGFGYWVPVVPNPLLRGVLTAVLWMVEADEKRTFYTTNLEHAVTKVHELYRSIGHALPDIQPASYRLPDKP